MEKHKKSPEELDREIDALFAEPGLTSPAKKELAAAFSGLDKDPEFLAAYWKAQFVEDILAVMEEQGVSKGELARRLGRTPQYVGSALNENTNFTIETMVRIATALDMYAYFGLRHADERVDVVPDTVRWGVLEPFPVHKHRSSALSDFEVIEEAQEYHGGCDAGHPEAGRILPDAA